MNIKIFIIAALSADGFIARDPLAPSTIWTSKEDKKRFIELTKRAGVIITGQNTWKTFFGKPLKDRLNIIYSPERLPDMPKNVETTTKEPIELIKELEARGFKEVAICGGSQIYTMFMKSGLVNSLYLTIEPTLFGNGVRLFKETLDFKLELVNLEKTEGGTILVEYKVVK